MDRLIDRLVTALVALVVLLILLPVLANAARAAAPTVIGVTAFLGVVWLLRPPGSR